MRINNNIPALTAFNALTANTNSLQKVIKQVSTGLRINSAADDAAGLAISENMRAQTMGLERAMMNAQDGISLLQTAEGALGETNSMLQRMRELAIQAANDTLTSQDRSYLQMEIDELKANINNIAGNTQFNNKRLLDGSCCGTWTSTEVGTKAYIRGEIEAEGNYRIEVKAEPGAAQVQKSNIFRIKHENTVTNAQLNADNGIGGVSVDGLPAGNYEITATQPGGGDTTVTYVSTAKVDIANENESGVPETLLLRLTGKNEEGTTVSWPSSNSSSPSYVSNARYYNGNYYYQITIPKDSSKKDIASLIKTQLDGKAITLCSNNTGADPTKFTLEVNASNGSCTITSTSTQGELSGITFATQSQSNVYPGSTSSLSRTVTSTDTTYEASIAGRITLPDGVSSTSSASTITFTVSENGATLGTHNVTIPAGSTVNDIADLIKDINTPIAGTTLKGYDVGSTNYSITASNGSNASLKVQASVTGGEITLAKTDSGAASAVNRYTMTHTDTPKFNSGIPRGSGDEKYTLRLYGVSSRTNVSLGEAMFEHVETDEDGNIISGDDTIAKISDKIIELVNNNPSIKMNGVDVLLEAEKTASGGYKITTTNSNEQVYFYFSNYSGPAATSKVNNATFTTETSSETAPAATSSLTGFYGDQEAADSIGINVNLDTQNNASILFEVTASAFDEALGTGTLTLSAQSHVLTVDGKTENHTNSKIIFSTSDSSPVDVSSLLGEDSGALSISLDPAKFKIGDKFVVNVSGNGSRKNPADASLYINGSQDDTWPYSWGNKDYVTYNNNRLYYNVNAEAVSSKELRIRNYYLDSEMGRVHDGEITLSLNRDFGAKAADFPPAASGEDGSEANELMLGSFTANYVGKIAEGGTKLRDIEQFWNTQTGVFMLSTPQVITVSQNDGKSASVTIDASDTLNDLRKKLNDAISEGLGQGLYTSAGNSDKFVTLVESPTAGGTETVKGTLLVRSVIPGSAGELTFTSINGDLIDALGLNTIQSAEATSYSASVYNAHTGAVIAQNVKTEGNMLHGVIDKNIDVEFDAMSGLNAVWSDKDKNFILMPENAAAESFLHIVKNNVTFQTGAGKGEDITLDIGDMSAAGLGIGGINIMSRERASDAISVLDEAIRQVSSQRTKIGAYQNELERTLETLTVNATNLTGAESRIRDADMSKSMMDLVKYQIIHQSGTSMLGQANQLTQSVLGLLQ